VPVREGAPERGAREGAPERGARQGAPVCPIGPHLHAWLTMGLGVSVRMFPSLMLPWLVGMFPLGAHAPLCYAALVLGGCGELGALRLLGCRVLSLLALAAGLVALPALRCACSAFLCSVLVLKMLGGYR
jgi:hypothetical protein